MKSAAWTAAACALAALLPAACSGTGEETAADAPASDGVTVSNGWMALPPVRGNPAAVYFDITNSAAGDATIVAVSVEGTESAMLHHTMTTDGQSTMEHMEEQAVPAGETVKFEPGGMHVMAMNPADTLQAGGTTQVTLTLGDGETIAFPAEIRAPGDPR